MRRFAFLLLASTFATFLGSSAGATEALHFSSGLDAKIDWIAGPMVENESRFRLSFLDAASQAPAEPSGPVKVQLFMPDMGHGSGPVKITRSSASVFDVSNAYFVMSGVWEVRVTLKNTNGTNETRALSVDVK